MEASPIDSAKYKLRVGCPSPKHQKQAADILRKACLALHDDPATPGPDLAYGRNAGSRLYLEQLAEFLTQAYNEPVESDNLVLTAGATHGLHIASTLLFKSGSPIFVVDPTYFLAIGLLQDLHYNVIPVPSDEGGIVIQELERLFKIHRKSAVQEVSSRTPYWAMVYIGTVLANPNNVSLSEERCRSLVDLARKHDVLVFTEDVYNILNFDGKPVRRLFSYDTSSNGEMGNHVISNGTFSKLLSPGIRVGWMEAGPTLLKSIMSGNLFTSGGAMNHYSSQLVAVALFHGWIQEHVERVKRDLKDSMNVACAALAANLPPEAAFVEPAGGYFIWIRLAQDIDGEKFMKWLSSTHDVTVISGVRFSPSGGYKNYIRISITNIEGDLLKEGVEKLCEAIREYTQTKR